jgi:hypothetical protein
MMSYEQRGERDYGGVGGGGSGSGSGSGAGVGAYEGGFGRVRGKRTFNFLKVQGPGT